MRNCTHVFWILLLAGLAAWAQRPPVVIVGGYHLICDAGTPTSAGSFGQLEQKLTAQSIRVRFVDSCQFSGKPRIEDLAAALGGVITSLNVPQVDIISHSMGGLIVRSYVAGKQTASGLFNPPLDPKIRKWVSIATPNFGALFGGPLAQFAPDEEVRELLPDSQFLFDLATWNQDHDDLHGIDAVAVSGNAGGFGPFSGASDGLVPLPSASLKFTKPDERTRIIPYCHSDNELVTIFGGGCNGPPIAKVQSDDHLTYRIIQSFLSGTEEWKTIGHAPSQDSVISKLGGIERQPRDKDDNATGAIDNQDFVTAPISGGYTVVIDKPGPRIYLVAPAAARLDSLSLAPRMIVSIYGDQLEGATLAVNGQTLTLFYSSSHQINALLPSNISGLVKLTLTNAQGRYAENLMIDDVAPAVFSSDASGAGAAAVIRTGNFVSLYLTGLGTGGKIPVVTVNGTNANVTFAGPAPGFQGLDQINIEIPAGVPTGVAVPVVVQSGKHLSNTTTLTL